VGQFSEAFLASISTLFFCFKRAVWRLCIEPYGWLFGGDLDGCWLVEFILYHRGVFCMVRLRRMTLLLCKHMRWYSFAHEVRILCN
jgi:hypothetical protein